MTPVVRVATLGAGAVSLILIGAGVAYYFSHRAPEWRASGSRVASAPYAPPSLPGDPMLPDVAGAYDRSERQNRAAAEHQPGAAAAVPPIATLEPVQPLTPPPNPAVLAEEQRRQREIEREQRKQAEASETARQAAIRQRAQTMGKVLAAWGGIHKTVEATLEASPPEPPDAAPVARYDPLVHLSVDQLYYGLLRVYISSDEPGPVVVALKDGELDGARLIGRFQRADEKVVIHFDRMTFQSAWYTVDAVAINPENGRLGLATEVDRRTFTRWAALLGSALLQGVQRAYLSQGTQSSYLWGQTTTNDFDDRELLGIAVGEIGTRTRQAANTYFNRPPTVYVDPAIQLVGVLFLAPPRRQTPGEAPLGAARDPRRPQDTARDGELARAAAAATNLARTPAATGQGASDSSDPGANSQNYPRPRVRWPAVAVPGQTAATESE